MAAYHTLSICILVVIILGCLSKYDHINDLLHKKQWNKAFHRMKVSNKPHLADEEYWTIIALKMANMFNTDQDTLLKFGTAMTKRNVTRNACFKFLSQIKLYNQSDTIKYIVIEFVGHHLPNLSKQNLTIDDNRIAFVVQEMAKIYRSKDLRVVFNYLAQGLPTVLKKTIEEKRRARFRKMIQRFESSIFADNMDSETNWKICIFFASVLNFHHILYPYDPVLWAVNRMKRYKPSEGGRQYYVEIFRWIRDRIVRRFHKRILTTLRTQFPYDKDAEWLESTPWTKIMKINEGNDI